MLLAPLLALAEQAILYALATPTCQTQREAWLHALPVAFTAMTALLTAAAWTQARRLRREGLGEPHTDGDGAALRRYFVACVAAGLGLLSTLAIVALWIPQWVLSPCAS
jgi:hypothetical protein